MAAAERAAVSAAAVALLGSFAVAATIDMTRIGKMLFLAGHCALSVFAVSRMPRIPQDQVRQQECWALRAAPLQALRALRCAHT